MLPRVCLLPPLLALLLVAAAATRVRGLTIDGLDCPPDVVMVAGGTALETILTPNKTYLLQGGVSIGSAINLAADTTTCVVGADGDKAITLTAQPANGAGAFSATAAGAKLGLADVTLDGQRLYGPAVVLSGTGASLYAQQASFVRCARLGGQGGAVVAQGAAVVKLAQVRFLNNTAASAAAMSADFSSVTLDEVVFAHNSASFSGGALLLGSSAHADIRASTFTGNSAAEGGALVVFSSRLDVRLTMFERNSATSAGGAVASQTGTISFHTVVCRANVAPQGGCVNLNGASTLEFSDGDASDLRDNTADAVNILSADAAVRCGGGSQPPWARLQAYQICGPACRCNGAFVAGTSTNCPCPGPCTNKRNGASCLWVPPERTGAAARTMADASEGTLVRTSAAAAAAATIMAARDEAATTAAYDGGSRLQPCQGTCRTGVCVLTPQAQFCCYAAGRDDSYGDDGYGYYDARLQQRAGGDGGARAPAAAAQGHVSSAGAAPAADADAGADAGGAARARVASLGHGTPGAPFTCWA